MSASLHLLSVRRVPDLEPTAPSELDPSLVLLSHGCAMPDAVDDANRPFWRRLLNVPVAVAAAAMTAGVTWGVTKILTSAETAATSEHPLAWAVETNPAKVGGFADMPIELVLPGGTHPTTGPGPGCSSFVDWGMRQGGIAAGTTNLAVFLRGRVDGQVLVSDARAVIVGRRPPSPGIRVRCPSAAEANLRPLTINLDGPDTKARYVSSSGRRFGFTLQKGETETFLLSARAKRAAYRWYLELTLIIGSTQKTVRIDDHGRLFQTTSPTRGDVFDWNDPNGWVGPHGQRIPVGAPLGAQRGSQ